MVGIFKEMNVKSLIKSLPAYCGTKYAIGVANGLDALILIPKSI